ncbi:hypothetical protein SAMN05444172_2319 [Burkholderia sp. GAS332]|nr:hypothetical protein SAMN05444172_2319 [Burkholderia sp. GAS332]
MRKYALHAFMLLVTAGSAHADNLYKGEQRIVVDGYPAVVRYFAGDPQKPLVVFSAGAHHTARISYGGHPGARSQDFIAYWLNKLGYNFLAVSYPIETTSGFIDAKPTPDFNAQKWGQQVAQAAKLATIEHHLSGHVVLLNWSMAGKVLQPAFKAASAAGLTVDGAIAMVATPGITGFVPNQELKKTSSGYADRRDMYGRWLKQIAVENADNGGREIIPESVYRSDYVGDIPVGLEGYGEVYKGGKFEIDDLAQATDYGAFEFANYPLIAILQDNSALDAEHGLVDRYWWGTYNVETFLNRVKKAGVDFSSISQPEWHKISDLSEKMNDQLTIRIDGNHFFFVGEKGASRTAEAVDLAIRRLSEFNKDVDTIK